MSDIPPVEAALTRAALASSAQHRQQPTGFPREDHDAQSIPTGDFPQQGAPPVSHIRVAAAGAYSPRDSGVMPFYEYPRQQGTQVAGHNVQQDPRYHRSGSSSYHIHHQPQIDETYQCDVFAQHLQPPSSHDPSGRWVPPDVAEPQSLLSAAARDFRPSQQTQQLHTEVNNCMDNSTDRYHAAACCELPAKQVNARYRQDQPPPPPNEMAAGSYRGGKAWGGDSQRHHRSRRHDRELHYEGLGVHQRTAGEQKLPSGEAPASSYKPRGGGRGATVGSRRHGPFNPGQQAAEVARGGGHDYGNPPPSTSATTAAADGGGGGGRGWRRRQGAEGRGGGNSDGGAVGAVTGGRRRRPAGERPQRGGGGSRRETPLPPEQFFTYEPYRPRNATQHRPLAGRRKQPGGSSGGGQSSFLSSALSSQLPYNKERFVRAKFRLYVGADADIQSARWDPDFAVDWEQVICVDFMNPRDRQIQCPICLEDNILAPQITKCGHVFCWPCILRYLKFEKDKQKYYWRRCPLCFDAVTKRDLRSARILPTEIISVGGAVDLCLVHRSTAIVRAPPHVRSRLNQLDGVHRTATTTATSASGGAAEGKSLPSGGGPDVGSAAVELLPRSDDPDVHFARLALLTAEDAAAVRRHEWHSLQARLVECFGREDETEEVHAVIEALSFLKQLARNWYNSRAFPGLALRQPSELRKSSSPPSSSPSSSISKQRAAVRGDGGGGEDSDDAMGYYAMELPTCWTGSSSAAGELRDEMSIVGWLPAGASRTAAAPHHTFSSLMTRAVDVKWRLAKFVGEGAATVDDDHPADAGGDGDTSDFDHDTEDGARQGRKIGDDSKVVDDYAEGEKKQGENNGDEEKRQSHMNDDEDDEDDGFWDTAEERSAWAREQREAEARLLAAATSGAFAAGAATSVRPAEGEDSQPSAAEAERNGGHASQGAIGGCQTVDGSDSGTAGNGGEEGFFFYQVSDGRAGYLDPLLTRCLWWEYCMRRGGKWSLLPPLLRNVKVKDIHSLTISDDSTRKSNANLAHLPISAEVKVLWIDVRPFVSDDTWNAFSHEIQKIETSRKKDRQRQQRDERRHARTAALRQQQQTASLQQQPRVREVLVEQRPGEVPLADIPKAFPPLSSCAHDDRPSAATDPQPSSPVEKQLRPSSSDIAIIDPQAPTATGVTEQAPVPSFSAILRRQRQREERRLLAATHGSSSSKSVPAWQSAEAFPVLGSGFDDGKAPAPVWPRPTPMQPAPAAAAAPQVQVKEHRMTLSGRIKELNATAAGGGGGGGDEQQSGAARQSATTRVLAEEVEEGKAATDEGGRWQFSELLNSNRLVGQETVEGGGGELSSSSSSSRKKVAKKKLAFSNAMQRSNKNFF